MKKVGFFPVFFDLVDAAIKIYSNEHAPQFPRWRIFVYKLNVGSSAITRPEYWSSKIHYESVCPLNAGLEVTWQCNTGICLYHILSTSFLNNGSSWLQELINKRTCTALQCENVRWEKIGLLLIHVVWNIDRVLWFCLHASNIPINPVWCIILLANTGWCSVEQKGMPQPHIYVIWVLYLMHLKNYNVNAISGLIIFPTVYWTWLNNLSVIG